MKVVGFAGFSGSGKTTLVEQLIPALKLRGLRVSVVKHAHHRFDIDHPGKDTWRHREAGAFEVVVASAKRLVLMREFERDTELSVHHLLAELYAGVDWVLASSTATCRKSGSGARRAPSRPDTPTIHSSWPSPPTAPGSCPWRPSGHCWI
jgi:Molybdopterin guanine dinucleotide synthesis protein B